jgi:hypothetical protein
MPGPTGALPTPGAVLVVGVVFPSSVLMVQPVDTGMVSATAIVSVAATARSTWSAPADVFPPEVMSLAPDG